MADHDKPIQTLKQDEPPSSTPGAKRPAGPGEPKAGASLSSGPSAETCAPANAACAADPSATDDPDGVDDVGVGTQAGDPPLPALDPSTLSMRERAAIMSYQQSIATEAEAYRRIADRLPDGDNRSTLLRIASEKAADADAWVRLTGTAAAPHAGRARRYAGVARVLGFTFAVKLMDKQKHVARRDARALAARLPEVARIEAAEERRGRELMGLLDEKLLSYVGAMVLGMNDAVVEITGTLAGLTLAMQNTRLIALSGLITGIAATLSMAASEYLAAKSDGRPDAKRACLYTGGAYALTVVLLLIPYLVLPNNLYLLAMAIMLAVVVLILWAFNFYTSVAQDLPFKRRFGQMCAISLGVAALSFGLGLFCKIVLGVDV